MISCSSYVYKKTKQSISRCFSLFKEFKIETTKISESHQNWLISPCYKEVFDSTQAEFVLARQLIEACIKRVMSQSELAVKMGTSQSIIADLESGKSMPSMRTLSKFAKAINAQLLIKFKLS